MAVSRADLAVPLLTQSPPGQLTNVYDDLLGLLASDGDQPEEDAEQFKAKADAAREQHNVEQSIVVELPDKLGQAILCQSAAHVGKAGRYLSPRHRVSYEVDHATLKTADAKPYKANEHVEELRAGLEIALSAYVKDRYATGVVEVFAIPLPRKVVEVPASAIEEAKAAEAEENVEMADPQAEEKTGEGGVVDGDEKKDEVKDVGEAADEEMKDDPVEAAATAEAVEEDMEADAAQQSAEATTESKDEEQFDEETQGATKLVIHLVANKYKLSNFWSGRWRSSFVLDSPEASEMEASCNVQIHYFEEGNVQLHSAKNEQLTVQNGSSTEAYVKAIVKAVEGFEEKYQQELFKQSAELSEGAFRALRRQLPMTRQKIDWDKVLNYKLGNELSKQ